VCRLFFLMYTDLWCCKPDRSQKSWRRRWHECAGHRVRRLLSGVRQFTAAEHHSLWSSDDHRGACRSDVANNVSLFSGSRPKVPVSPAFSINSLWFSRVGGRSLMSLE
jgi:hypothetical protein